jgi:hypothetical protein
MSTLEAEPNKFFVYNNGITIVANNVTSDPASGRNKYILGIDGMQLVNGGQSIRTVFKFIGDNRSDWMTKIESGRVLVKIVETEGDTAIRRRIAQYTNSQNPISIYDLRSMDDIQVELESYLVDHGIAYIRKLGDIGIERPSDLYTISMRKVAQIIYSSIGFPNKASSNKKDLFDIHYNEIFKNDDAFLERTVGYINDYKKVVEVYSSTIQGKKEFSDQRSFYVLYIMNKMKDKNISIQNAISLFNEALVEFQSDSKKLTPNISMLRNKFKELLDEKCDVWVAPTDT